VIVIDSEDERHSLYSELKKNPSPRIEIIADEPANTCDGEIDVTRKSLRNIKWLNIPEKMPPKPTLTVTLPGAWRAGEATSRRDDDTKVVSVTTAPIRAACELLNKPPVIVTVTERKAGADVGVTATTRGASVTSRKWTVLIFSPRASRAHCKKQPDGGNDAKTNTRWEGLGEKPCDDVDASQNKREMESSQLPRTVTDRGLEENPSRGAIDSIKGWISKAIWTGLEHLLAIHIEKFCRPNDCGGETQCPLNLSLPTCAIATLSPKTQEREVPCTAEVITNLKVEGTPASPSTGATEANVGRIDDAENVALEKPTTSPS
jgi:hypothetical protein